MLTTLFCQGRDMTFLQMQKKKKGALQIAENRI